MNLIWLPEATAAFVLISFLLKEIVGAGSPRPVKGAETAPLRAKPGPVWGIGLLAIAASLYITHNQFGIAFSGLFISDSFSCFFKWIFTGVLAVILFMSGDFFANSNRDSTEYYLVLWSSFIGFFFLVSSYDLVILFISLEIVTLSFYVLTGYSRDQASIEASLKYLILGSVASACVIYGISLIYSQTGTTHFAKLGEIIASRGGVSPPGRGNLAPTIIIGFVLILAGLGFKIAAFPFQFWVPDVYQGSPTPVAAYLAGASKVAGFAVLMRLILAWNVGAGFPRPDPGAGTAPLLFSVLAILSILFGNLGACLQQNMKRLLGYSGIGHAGYLLIGLAIGSPEMYGSMLYYFVTYAMASLAAFYVVTLIDAGARHLPAGRQGAVPLHLEQTDLEFYRGLSQKSPFLAAILFIALLSMAGIPPLAGFFAKFLILFYTVNAGMLSIALWGILFIPVSLYYSLRVVKAMYLEETSHTDKIKLSKSSVLILSFLAAGILILGFWPAPLFQVSFQTAASLF